MRRVFVDTSAWFAYINRADRDHRAVGEVLRTPDLRLVTSSYVFDETVTLCRYRLGHAAAVRVGRVLRDGAEVDIVHVTPVDEGDAWALFLDRADQEYSFTDCSSFVLMRRLKLTECLALDDDFRSEGFVVLPS